MIIEFMEKKYTIQELKKIANDIRMDIIKMLERVGSGHTGGSLGVTDILVSLYFGSVLNYNPKKPNWQERDRFILSNGHVCPALYAILAKADYFPKAKLKTLRKINTQLQGHPSRVDLLGIEFSTASLGQGIGGAGGMAWAGKKDKADYKVFCLTSDGEHQEGSTWEAVNFASHYKLNNLINIIDRNYIQISGKTEELMHIDPLAKKYGAFGWQVLNVNGHSIPSLLKALEKAKKSKTKPTVIIARTVIGKGVSFMENDCAWHGKAPKPEEAKRAIHELITNGTRI